MVTPVDFGDRRVGPGEPCYVIAEIGSNHDRDLDKARALIERAASAGVDAVKFQTFSGRSLYSTKTPQFDYLADISDRKPHELLEDIELPREWQPLLAEHARGQGVHFISAAFDRQAVDAVRQWKFDPGTRGGEPVAVEVAIEMTFRLKK